MELKHLTTKASQMVILFCCVFNPIFVAAQSGGFTVSHDSVTYDTRIDVAQPLTPGRQFALFNQLLFGGKGDPEISVRRTYLPSDVEEIVTRAIMSSNDNNEIDIDEAVKAWTSAKLLIPSSGDKSGFSYVPYWNLVGVGTIDNDMTKGDWIAIDELPSELVYTVDIHRELWSSWGLSGSSLDEYTIELDASGFNLYDKNKNIVLPGSGVAELLFDLHYINSSGIGASGARIALDYNIANVRSEFFVIENLDLPLETSALLGATDGR